MQRPTITDNQLLLLLDLCMEAEERCSQHIADARQRNDGETEDQYAKLREYYFRLKARLFAEVQSNEVTSADLQDGLMLFAESMSADAGAALSPIESRLPDNV